MISMIYNPWHGCHRFSSGCQHCFIFSMDAKYGRNPSVVVKTKRFDILVKKNRHNEYVFKTTNEPIYTCLSSDFFIEEADQWRNDVWEMIKERNDLQFYIITKRINRFKQCIPNDWQYGYDNVTIILTIEDQACLDKRLPIFVKLPIKHKQVNCEPLLEALDFKEYLSLGDVKLVSVGGESGYDARVLDYQWVLDILSQCIRANVSFRFKQTGANFLKDGKYYRIPKAEQHSQAKRSGIDYIMED